MNATVSTTTSMERNEAHEITYEESLQAVPTMDMEEDAASFEGASYCIPMLVDEDNLIRLPPTAVFQVPDESGQLLSYNEDCNAIIGLHEEAKIAHPEPTTTKAHPQHVKGPSCTQRAIDIVKYICSVALLAVSVASVMAAIFTRQTKIAESTSPWLAFGIIWSLILWLAVMEGGQNCLVGLQPIDKKLYAETHLAASKCTNLAHKGDNMRRFIVGRQFLVVLVVFMINLCGSPIGEAPSVLGFSPIVSEILLTSGLALILMTTVLGQLTAQINASIAMLDFINNYFMLFTTYVSLAIEISGLLHAVYLVQYVFSKIAGTPIESSEAPRSKCAALLFWGRALVSLVILSFAFAVTLSALFQGSTTMYAGVPEWASVLILFLLMAFVGLMEGMQIALFAVVNLPSEELDHHKLAAKTCELVFRDSNLQAFLVGRQICATICTFIIARITSINVDSSSESSKNIFGVSNGLQSFFNTGLLGALITTIVGSLAWRVIAASFPLAFLSNPLIFVIVRLCLLLEASGVCESAWLLAWVQKKIVRYRRDVVYIGSKPTQKEAVDVDPEQATVTSS